MMTGMAVKTFVVILISLAMLQPLHAQSPGPTTVEVVINPKKRIKPSECNMRVRLVSGGSVEYRTKRGNTILLTNPNTVACIRANGRVSYSTGTQSILP
jgi:hypothetical protein